MRTNRRLTDAERDQRREHDRQGLHRAAEQLPTSDGWRRWVYVRARGGLAREGDPHRRPDADQAQRGPGQRSACERRLRILIHELGVGYAEYGREWAEVIVDTVTYPVAAGVGLDVSGESVPYVAGWGRLARSTR